MPQVKVKLPNGHEYTVNDPNGTLTDAQAYQAVLDQDPDAKAMMAQQRAQEVADHPWRAALEDAPKVLGAAGRTIAAAPGAMLHTLTAPVRAMNDPVGSIKGAVAAAQPIVDAAKEAWQHPNEIGPAFLQGMADPEVMGSTAGNLAITAATANPEFLPGVASKVANAGAKGLALGAKVPEALAGSIPAQKAVMGVAGAGAGATGAALGLPGQGMMGEAVGALLGSKASGLGVTPEIEAATAVKIAQKNLVTAMQEQAASPKPWTADNVALAKTALQKAEQNAARSTTVGRLSTKAASAMRAPQRFMQGLVEPPPVVPPTMPPAGPAVPPSAGPVVPPTPPNPIAGAAGSATPPIAMSEMATPQAQAFMAQEGAKNAPIMQGMRDAGAFQGDRTTGSVTPGVFQGDKSFPQNGAFGKAPEPMAPQAAAADATVAQNRAASGIVEQPSLRQQGEQAFQGGVEAGKAQRDSILKKLNTPSPDDVMRSNMLSNAKEVDLTPELNAPKAQPDLNKIIGDTYDKVMADEAAAGIPPTEVDLASQARRAGLSAPKVDLTGDLNALPDATNIGSAADIRALIQEKLKDPNANLVDLRRQVGADRLGKELAATNPEASSGALQRIKFAPSAMPDRAQEALMRDLSADPASLSPETRARVVRAVTQLTKEYTRNGGPADSDVARALFERLTK